jgi:hypothetical protein
LKLITSTPLRYQAAQCNDESLYFPLADVPRFLEELRESAHVAAAIQAAVGGV